MTPLQLPDRTTSRCAAAGSFCDGTLDVAFVSGGLHLEPGSGRAIAPYAYATVGLYHLSAGAEAQGLRVRLSGRVTLRAGLRRSGFSFKPGRVNWTSVVTRALTTSVAF